jgi:hypothetical protein
MTPLWVSCLAWAAMAGLALLGALNVYRWHLRRKLARIDAEIAALEEKSR